MNQSPEKITFTRRELLEFIAFITIGLGLLFIWVAYNITQLFVVLFSIHRSAKFFSQTKKDSQISYYQKISLILGINWLLLASIGVVSEINHQFDVFEPATLLNWRQLLLPIIVFMYINESVYDYLRAQNQDNKFWYKWAIIGKMISLFGLFFVFIWLSIGLPESNFIIWLIVSPLILGHLMWLFAHSMQPNESDLEIE